MVSMAMLSFAVMTQCCLVQLPDRVQGQQSQKHTYRYSYLRSTYLAMLMFERGQGHAHAVLPTHMVTRQRCNMHEWICRVRYCTLWPRGCILHALQAVWYKKYMQCCHIAIRSTILCIQPDRVKRPASHTMLTSCAGGLCAIAAC